MPTADRVGIWQVPVGGQAPAEVPAHWVSALAAVSQDLQCRRYGRTISFDDVAWVLIVHADGRVYIGITPLGVRTDVGGFERGAGYILDTTAAQAMVWIAEAIQDELAGYEFVQWPIDGQRILVPEIRDDNAVWVRRATNDVVCRIGDLCRQPTDTP
jgi:hypothetical protein